MSYLNSIREHQTTMEALVHRLSEIEAVGFAMIRCLRTGGKVLWMGNGGSAADSQHLAAELVGRFEHERGSLASLALTTDTSALTAVANDYGFEQIFARQIQAIGNRGDLAVGLSTSGNSANVVEGLRAAAALGLITVGLTGGDGGEVARLTEHCVVVPSHRTARIQEAHILIGHMLCEHVEVAMMETADNE